MAKGWFLEGHRHSLAARGMKTTNQKIKISDFTKEKN